jgi:myo-inositol-1(or 4)-monophosphatase
MDKVTPQDKYILISAVRIAGERLLSNQSSDRLEETKRGEFDLGVQADLDSERILFEHLKQLSFLHRIVSEEAGKRGDEDAPYVIYIDPLDGTVNYSKGIPTFCISVGVYTAEQEPVFSVIFDPSANELLVADGTDLTLNGHKVVRRFDPRLLLINLDWFGAEKYVEYLQLIKEKGLRARGMGSGVLNLLYTSLGRGEISLLLENKPWDIAAGLHMCLNSSLKVVSLTGKKVDLSQHKQSLLIYPPETEKEIEFLLP